MEVRVWKQNNCFQVPQLHSITMLMYSIHFGFQCVQLHALIISVVSRSELNLYFSCLHLLSGSDLCMTLHAYATENCQRFLWSTGENLKSAIIPARYFFVRQPQLLNQTSKQTSFLLTSSSTFYEANLAVTCLIKNGPWWRVWAVSLSYIVLLPASLPVNPFVVHQFWLPCVLLSWMYVLAVPPLLSPSILLH